MDFRTCLGVVQVFGSASRTPEIGAEPSSVNGLRPHLLALFVRLFRLQQLTLQLTPKHQGLLQCVKVELHSATPLVAAVLFGVMSGKVATHSQP